MIKILEYSKVNNEEIFSRMEDTLDVSDIVSDIILNVRKNGDKAVLEYCEKFDKCKLTSLEVTAEEIDEAGEDSEVSLKSIIGGDILGSDWFRRQFFYIFFLGVLSILYVTNRYSYQSELLKQTKLKRELEDRRKRALVANSELTSFLRNKSILENLPDTTIHPTVDPFYYINLNEK